MLNYFNVVLLLLVGWPLADAPGRCTWQMPLQYNGTVRSLMACCAHLADAPVGGEDDNGRQAALQRSVEVGEALDVQHVHLINEQHTRHQLCYTLVNVSVDHLQQPEGQVSWAWS